MSDNLRQLSRRAGTKAYKRVPSHWGETDI